MPEPRPQNSQTALLVQLVQDVAEIKAGISSVQDHEMRLRELEKARWSSAWLTGLLSSGISAILYTLISNQLGK